MDASLKKQLALDANKIRKGIIIGTFNAKSGHPGGSLDIAEVLAYLYGVDMKVDPANPSDPDRDRLVLSRAFSLGMISRLSGTRIPTFRGIRI